MDVEAARGKPTQSAPRDPCAGHSPRYTRKLGGGPLWVSHLFQRAAGLRISEALNLVLTGIDSKPVIRVRQGKGQKDRYVPLTAKPGPW
jgi:integrase